MTYSITMPFLRWMRQISLITEADSAIGSGLIDRNPGSLADVNQSLTLS